MPAPTGPTHPAAEARCSQKLQVEEEEKEEEDGEMEDGEVEDGDEEDDGIDSDGEEDDGEEDSDDDSNGDDSNGEDEEEDEEEEEAEGGKEEQVAAAERGQAQDLVSGPPRKDQCHHQSAPTMPTLNTLATGAATGVAAASQTVPPTYTTRVGHERVRVIPSYRSPAHPPYQLPGRAEAGAAPLLQGGCRDQASKQVGNNLTECMLSEAVFTQGAA